ncbi:hypothetical protein pb186bvf_016841 [Paramecium bursaria]
MRKFNQIIFSFSKQHLDPYFVLGINPGCTEEELKQAFLNLSKKYHPDVSSSPDAEEKMKQVVQAYAQLKDKIKTQYWKYQEKEDYSKMSKEEIFKDIFGFYYFEHEKEYYKPENAAKRQFFEKIMKKYHKQDASQDGNAQPQPEIKINRNFNSSQYVDKEQQQSNIGIYITITILLGGLIYSSIFYKKKQITADERKQSLDQNRIEKMRELQLSKQEQQISQVKEQFNFQGMLKYKPVCDAMDNLIKYTIFGDLKFYETTHQILKIPRQHFVKYELLEKKKIKKVKINVRLTHVLEAERCLQSIFVRIEDVLDQIKNNGVYKPPIVTFQYYGLIAFKIRNKPINIQKLINSDEYISLFDLYFQYKSPLPYYFNEFEEFRLENSKYDEDRNNYFIGNVYLNKKPLQNIYVQGPVKNVIVPRDFQNHYDKGSYEFIWEYFYQKFNK